MKKWQKTSIVVLFVFVFSNIFNFYGGQAYEKNGDISQVWLEETAQLEEGDRQYLKIRGWSIDKSGVKFIRVYIDDLFMDRADIGIERKDVNKAYPLYKDSMNAGFEAKIDITKCVTQGKRKIKVVSYGNDGSTVEREKIVNISKPSPKVWVEEAKEAQEGVNHYLLIKGWSVNSSSVKKVDVYWADMKIGEAETGIEREDVRKVYPTYCESENSGFTAKVDITKAVPVGKQAIKVVSTGVDDSTTFRSLSVNITKSAPHSYIEEIKETTEGSKQYLNIKGWAVNASGIKKIDVYGGSRYLISANSRIVREDVKNKYSSYYDAEHAGYTAKIDITTTLPAGKNTIKVCAIGNDGTREYVCKVINVTKPAPKTIIQEVKQTKEGNKTYLTVSGWSVSSAGVKKVDVYIDDKYMAAARTGNSTPDVRKSYSSYIGSGNAGFTAKIDITHGIKNGNRTIKVISTGYDGTKSSITTQKNISIQKLIAIDPGHLGHDSGACAFGKRESDLNTGVAVKLQKKLQSMGYKTYLTRSPLHPTQYSYLNTHDELKQRANAANNIKADLFISLHHDVAGSSSSGMWTFYSSWKPGIKNKKSDLRALNTGYDGNRDINPTKEAKLSKEFGQKVLNDLTSRCGYPAVKSYVVDRNLYVTEHTNMPAVLIELGMMSNRYELSRCASYSGQNKKAQVIADTVKSMF